MSPLARPARGSAIAAVLFSLVSLVARPASADEEAKPAASSTLTKRFTSEFATYADSDHITVFTPSIAADLGDVTKGETLHASYLVDVVSAASADIVSTASGRWHEVRQAGSVEAGYKPRELGVSVGGTVSSEPDYLSYGMGATVTRDFDEKNTTVILGAGYARDTAGRSGTPFSIFSRTIQHGAFDLGITQVVDRKTTLSFVGDLFLDEGDSSKPYRYIPMFAPNVAPYVPKGAGIDWVTANRLPQRPLEQLPLQRQRFALTSHLAHRFHGSTARVEERLYADSWLMVASTTDVRWIFDLGRRVTLWPHVREHLQTAVDFWRRAYVSTGSAGAWDLPELRTGDRELGPLRTTTVGAGTKWALGRTDPNSWTLTVQVDFMHTAFLDDLYLTSRIGGVGSLTLTGEL